MDIEGIWYNELGSAMGLVVEQGNVTGDYETAVSSGCAKGVFQLSGRTDVDSGGESVGWTVAWVNAASSCRSVTSWAGQYQVLDDGTEQITALWLLSTATAPEANWESTLVGQDVFMRTPPPADAQRRRRHSHP